MIEPPLPFGSAAGRWYYVLLKGLVDRGHRVTAFATYSQTEELAEACRLFPKSAFDLRLYPLSCCPDQTGGADGVPRGRSAGRWVAAKRILRKWQTLRQPYGYVFSPGFRQDLYRELSCGFDVLHLEQLWSGWLGLEQAHRALLNIHYLYDIDLAGSAQRTPADLARHLLTSRAERYLLSKYPTVRTLTPRLSARVQQLAPAAEIHTVPLGLDLSIYSLLTPQPSSGPPVVSLIGSFHWRPSISAAERLVTRLWPQIKRRVPSARLQIVGRQAKSGLTKFLGLPDVTIEQDVPDILPYFRDTDVLLYAPQEGSGMKVKVLEAFALGVSVVTNHAGVEGLPAEDGIHAGICEDDAGLIERTVTLLRDDKRRQRQRQAARALVGTHCSPAATLAGIEQVYESMAPTGGAGPTSASKQADRPATTNRSSPHWRREILSAALCTLVGVSLSILPHLLWWPRLGAPIWIADNDDLLYLSYAGQAYDNHPAWLSDPVLPHGGTAMYPWLQFLPGILLSKALGLGPMAVSLIWRTWAGLSIALAWYLVVRQYVHGPFWAAGLVVGLLADIGLLTSHLLMRQCEACWQLVSGQSGELLAHNPMLHTQWRIITPGLSLMFLLIYIWSLSSLRREPSWWRRACSGLSLGLLFYVYFYYWTAALLGLALALALDKGHRRMYLSAGTIGGLLGLPALIAGYSLKHSGLPDWALRNDYFLPIPRFSELLIPRLAIVLLAVGLLWVWLRRKDLIFLWALAAAGLVLANHQIVTGLQINNFHWSYVWGPALSLLAVLLVAGEVRLLQGYGAWSRLAVWAALLVGGGHLAAGFWFRAVEATQTRESIELTRNYQRYSLQRRGGSSIGLAPNAVLAGDKNFVPMAAIMDNQRPLYHYAADLSPSVSDEEWNDRIALDGFLRGLDRAGFAAEQQQAVADWVLGPWPRSPAKQAELLGDRLACFDRILADPAMAVDRFAVRYVALAADQSPSTYLRSEWQCLETGPYWSLWQRRPATRECTGY
jgi:polysaccharide biosynthesis protein PslH